MDRIDYNPGSPAYVVVPRGPGKIVFKFGGNRIIILKFTAKSGGKKGTFAPECTCIAVKRAVVCAVPTGASPTRTQRAT
eukprot:5760092-Pyramimonas_sp.AAC.1